MIAYGASVCEYLLGTQVEKALHAWRTHTALILSGKLTPQVYELAVVSYIWCLLYLSLAYLIARWMHGRHS